MPELIIPRSEILAAVQMGAKAFFRTTVFYHRVSDGIDRYGEGKGKTVSVFPFAALVVS